LGRRLLLLPAAVGVAVWPAFAPAQPPVRVTIVGDSVPAALQYVAGARRTLARGLDVHYDLQVCRRLATTGCPYRGGTPSSALEMVKAAGTSLGPVLVVDVGYNDDPAAYARGMDDLIRAAQAAGVQRIVWVTLRETRDLYGRTDAVIRKEAQRFPQVEVADWNAYSQGKPWFRADGLHLNADGAAGLAAMLRPFIARAAGASS
jgi:lysophospholipase L1-like esterase